MYKSKFFFAEDILPGVWRISNCFCDKKSMKVYSYLIEGSERAMVIDTMMGYGNLKSFCREVTDKPIILVNTHHHPDHTLGNYDFDECYIHPLDMPALYSADAENRNDLTAFKEKRYKQIVGAAMPELRDMILPTDFSMPHPMRVIPIWDGDIFNLGGRQIEVIHVAGHSAGEIVLLDRSMRAVYTGDACNSNTLLHFNDCLSIEEYLEYLHHFKKFQSEFDMCYGGHGDFTPVIIDEAIELCGKIIDGSDDKEPGNFFGSPLIYAAAHDATGRRADGKSCNIAYSTDNIHRKPAAPRVL